MASLGYNLTIMATQSSTFGFSPSGGATADSPYTLVKHFMFPRSYLLHVLLHRIQTLHLPSLLPTACPPSPHPNTSSSLSPTYCMSSFTTSKHFIFPLSYLLHVLLHHIQTLHLPSLLPTACPPSPHPNTSSSLSPTYCMSSFTTSKHFIFPLSYLLHVLLHHIQTLHLPSLLPTACPPSPHPNTSSSLSPTYCMSSFTTSKHFIFPLSYLLHVLLHHIQTLHLPSLLPTACPPSPHPNTSSSLSPTYCMSSFTTSKHFIFPLSYLLHVLLHHIQTLHLPSLLPTACPPSPHPNTSSSLSPTYCMSSFTTSKHFIFPLSYLLHVLLHHIQSLHLPSLLPTACPPSPHPNTSSPLSPTYCMSSFTTSNHSIFPLSYLLHVLLHHIQSLHLPSLLPTACPPSPHPNTSSSLSPTYCMSSFTTSNHFIFPLSYLLHVLLHHIQSLHLPSLLPTACPPSPHPITSSSLSPTYCMSSFTTSNHFIFPLSYLLHVLLHHIQTLHLPSLLPTACPPSPHPNTSSSLSPTYCMSSFTTSKHFIFPLSYLLHVLLHHIQTLHLPSLLPTACPPSPHPNTSSSLTPTYCMSSFTTSKHFIFPLSYLLHVLLHHIQTLHLLSLLPPACPPSPHPNTSSSLSPISCMSSFTTSKHFIFPLSYLLHVLLHHIQTLHLPSLLPRACPPSPHPNTSSSLAPTSCMSSFTTSKHFIFPRSYLLHVLLHHIQTLHLPSLLPTACPPSPHPNTSSSLSPTYCMSSFTTSKHFIFPHSYLLHVLLHHIQTLHLPSLLPTACPPSPHPNT